MKSGIKSLKKSVAFAALLVCVTSPLFAAENDGTESGGGGHRMGDQFFDRWIRQKLFDPRKDPAFQEKVMPVLQKIREQVPAFANELEETLNKEWYTVKPKGKIAPAQAGIHFNAEEAAYQTDEEVYFDGEWLKKVDKSPEDRLHGYLHEMIQGVRVKHGVNAVEAANVWRLTVRLLNGKYATGDELSAALRKMGFGEYRSTARIKQDEVDRLARKQKEESARLAREQVEKDQKAKIDSEDQEIASIIASYRQKLVEVCSTHIDREFWHTDDPGTQGMAQAGKEFFNRIGAFKPEALVQQKVTNLAVGKSKEYRTRLLAAFEKMTGINLSVRILEDGRAEVFHADGLQILGVNYSSDWHSERIELCNRLGVSVSDKRQSTRQSAKQVPAAKPSGSVGFSANEGELVAPAAK